ncbi:MAG TPA: M6 family metalloprotease domain-containing protein, partial [Solirubrobacterales bacterium]|nr:M6 family metalloprotease domain-containing protein [Solirubrobacterales bacterium]
QPFGYNDGLIVPGTKFPLGTPPSTIRSAAAERAPLRGVVRVIVVLVDFSDKQMSATPADLEKLFFSQGEMATGSVRDYYKEVTHGLIDIQGEVVGPLRLPQKLTDYANGEAGIGDTLPSARTMARHAAEAADAKVDFGPYDNDGNGYVDAFIVVHAGSGAEVTLKKGDIWSHKWVMEGEEYVTDATKVYGYLTIPEDAKLGVCAHELGHLLFGWPDLYDTDESSEGIGDWCLMASGSWNGKGGDRPAHPSAWCKAGQGWVTVANQTANGAATIGDVKDSHTVHRLWADGQASQEYFLVENRQRAGFDDNLPGEGVLIWLIDEAVATNTNENHPKVALKQADGKRDLETRANQGDPGDPFPGSTGNRAFGFASTPSSKSYAGSDTGVAVTEISDSGPTMTARFSVQRQVPLADKTGRVGIDTKSELVDDAIAEKLAADTPPREKMFLTQAEVPGKAIKAIFDKQLHDKLLVEGPRQPDWPFGPPGEDATSLAGLETRLAAVEARLGQAKPFISAELRPDLSGGAFAGEPDVREKDQDRIDSPFEKRMLDVPPAIG